MTNCIYVEYDKFIVILTLISNLKAPTHNFQKHQEIRIFAQRNQDFMSIPNTHDFAASHCCRFVENQ